MRQPFAGFRGRRRLSGFGMALTTALTSLLMFGLAPARAAAGTATETAWLPLGCSFNPNISSDGKTYTGGIGIRSAGALRATHPDSLRTGDTFSLSAVSIIQVIPPNIQTAGAVYGPVNGYEGVVSDLETNLTNANSSFSPGSSNGGAQVNQVQALQPANGDALSPGTGGVPDDKAFVSPDSSDPSPLQAWADNNLPAADPNRQHVFSFGPIPIDASGAATGNAYGPAPGEGGGAAITDGTPRPLGAGLTVTPFTVTGTPSSTPPAVVIGAGDSSRTVTNAIAGYSGLALASVVRVFFNDPRAPQKHSANPPGTWIPAADPSYPSGGVLVGCGFDTSTNAVAPPPPGYCSNSPGTLPDTPAGCFVREFTIPIVPSTVVSETSSAIVLPLAGLLVIGAWLGYGRRRRSIASAP
jgi:hypothetical protein